MSRQRARRRGKSKLEQPAPAASTPPYRVELSKMAEDVYNELHRKMEEAERKGHKSGTHHTNFRMIQDALKRQIPHDPTNKKFSLYGKLANLFRMHKGRHRICWAVSSQKRLICILFISETLRKEGDVNDPYRIFEKALVTGQFDEVLGKLGVPKSPRLLLESGAVQ
jgi:mRNA-degrading endonuclease RelE of RelBE toxin-antitoxin system